jgi:hypothetical protein
MRHAKWLGAVVLLGVSPAVALASKPANKPQSAALYRAAARYEPAHIPARCLRIEVSSANSAWATVAYRVGPKGPLRGCVKYGFNGVTIFHYRVGRWRYVTEGSDFSTSNGGCALKGKLPQGVINDFRLC